METFNRYELNSLFNERKNKIKQYVTNMSDEDIISGQEQTIIENMYETYKFIPVTIDEEVIENREISKTKIDKYNEFYDFLPTYSNQPKFFKIDGVEVTCTFPFYGDKILFESRASIFSLSGTPEIDLYDNFFKISASETLDTMTNENNKNLLFERIHGKLESVKKYINYANEDVEKFNKSIRTYTENELKIRKEKVDKFYSVSEMLQIPIVKSNPKIIEKIRIERKIIPLIKKEKDNQKEYCISDEIYNDIIELIKHQGSTFERTPEVYSILQEEQLRDVILGTLNGVFKGKANGECFRKKGKTDISIEHENRAAFIAECKVWAGKKVLKSALNQLQSYITWRDNKLCLILFSRNKDFFKVLEEIKQTLPEEENFIDFKEKDKNEFEVKLKSKNNQGQIINVRIFAFDLGIT